MILRLCIGHIVIMSEAKDHLASIDYLERILRFAFHEPLETGKGMKGVSS